MYLLSHHISIQLRFICPHQCGLVGWVSLCKAKCRQFDSQSENMLGCMFGPQLVHARGNDVSLTDIDVSLPLSLPPFPSL